MNRNKEACHCHNVTYGRIIDAVEGGAASFAEVQAKTRCSTGCGRCREFNEAFVNELLEKKAKGEAL